MNLFHSSLLRIFLFFLAGLTLILPIPRMNPAQTKPVDKSQVLINVTVTNDKGNYITGLDKSIFTLSEEKTPLEINHFRAGDIPASVGIILDTSASMRLGDTQISVTNQMLGELISQFIKQSNQSNDYFVIGFNEQPALLADWTEDGTSVFKTVISHKRKGLTALYDACFMGVEKLGQAKHQKRVLLLITDGRGDSASQHKQKNMQRLLSERTDVLFYAVALPYDLQRPYALDTKPLVARAQQSGGRAFFTEDRNELNSAFELIALELRHQYLIGFTSSNDGKEHRIKIRLTPPANAPQQIRDFSIRSRGKYVAQ